jgi:hypothetical protein
VALSVSAPIRILALVGLLLAFGAGALRFMGGGSDTSTDVVPSRNSAVVHAKSVAARASARAKHPAAATTPATATHKSTTAKATAAKAPAAKATPAVTHAKAATKPTATAKTAATTKPAPPAWSSALPVPLARALAASPIVVAVLYNPGSEVDGIAVAEARAGAALAGTGFVALNVLSQRDVGKLTEQLGLLPDPAVLVFTRPAHLAARMDGFSDKETVAQAAHNAAHGT